jgi:superfamily II DNA or RNA helicase
MIKQIEFQVRAANEIATKLQKHRGVLLRGSTGLGKMYITCQVLKNLGQSNILWICPKNVKTQTARVLKEFGLSKNVFLFSYSELRSTVGQLYINWQADGNKSIPSWDSEFLPNLVVFDECQKLKNESSLAHQIALALPQNVKVILTTATPFQRLIDAKYFVVLTGLASRTEATGYLKYFGYDIFGYHPTYIERLRNHCEEVIVELKNVRFPYKAETECVTIPFASEQERLQYEMAFNEYVETCRRLGKSASASHLTALLKFRQKAEILRAPHLVKLAVEHVNSGRQVIIGSNFLDTLRQCWRHLKLSNFDTNQIAYITGNQSSEERQKMIDSFQNGQKQIMLLTVTAAGVGISLHHDRESSKPRVVVLPPTWSAIDLVQVLGRAHRITSISDTKQIIVWYKDTVEERVVEVVRKKLTCLQKAVIAREQFFHILDSSIKEEDVLQFESSAASSSEDEVEEFYDGAGLENIPFQYE